MRLKKNIIVVMLLAITLCVMELGLLTHAVSHIQDLTSQSRSPLDDQDKNPAGEHCPQCLGFAQADSAVVLPVLLFSLDNLSSTVEKITTARLISALTPTYSARAPPVSLS